MAFKGRGYIRKAQIRNDTKTQDSERRIPTGQTDRQKNTTHDVLEVGYILTLK